MAKKPATRRSVWTRQFFEEQKQAIREQVGGKLSDEQAVKFCLNEIADLSDQSGADVQLKRFIFAIKALSQLRKKVDFPLALACFFADCPTNYALEKCVILMLSKK